VKKRLEDKIAEEVNFISTTVSKVIGGLESRVIEIETEQIIIKNHYSNLENRINYLERKILKK